MPVAECGKRDSEDGRTVFSLAGAVIAFATARRTGLELLAIGLLGLAATLGVLLYELRNGEIKG